MTKEKCYNCNKKLKIISFPCDCKNTYCQKCRMPEDHSCTFNFKQKGRDQLKKQLEQVVTDKIIKI